MTKQQKHTLIRIGVATALLAATTIIEHTGMLGAWCAASDIDPLAVAFILYLIPYLVVGHDVIRRAFTGMGHGQMFDENFLMTVATFGAFALVFFPESEPHMAEGAAVMLFYQVGEFFQNYAVGKSRKSISDMMDISPTYANVMRDGVLVQIDPYELSAGDELIIKPGERIPLDGIVVSGSSLVDTSALTGESTPRFVATDDAVVSGCICMDGTITICATKPFEDSTISRILELVESAADKKAHTERFITRFARYYTPIVVGLAAGIAILPPLLLGEPWSGWVQRGLIFLVVSCPCALVISVPLSFFGGIGAASKSGVLIKGSNYLEALASADTVVFDKTGTLTSGVFSVSEVKTANGFSQEEVLRWAAHAEALSNHPVALAICEAYGVKDAAQDLETQPDANLAKREAASMTEDQLPTFVRNAIDFSLVSDVHEQGGRGVSANVAGCRVLVGSHAFMDECGVSVPKADGTGTVAYVAVGDTFAGCIIVGDRIKPDAAQAIACMHELGIAHIVMLTGDRSDIAKSVASNLKIDDVRPELLPHDKVTEVERLISMQHQGKKLIFAGDGINDAPVLMRADIGIAMGAIGSDVAIEAADVVIMNDEPSRIVTAMRIARKTMRIVSQNIAFALGVKFAVLILAAFGMANMWLAVFADVGVAALAILNAMRTLRLS